MLETEKFIMSRNLFAHSCEGEALVSEATWSHGANHKERPSQVWCHTPGIPKFTKCKRVRGSEIQGHPLLWTLSQSSVLGAVKRMSWQHQTCFCSQHQFVNEGTALMISAPALRMSLLAHFWGDMTDFRWRAEHGHPNRESAEMVPPQKRMWSSKLRSLARRC